MIEFNGNLTGSAETFFRKNFIRNLLLLFIGFIILSLPGVIFTSKLFNTPLIVIGQLAIALFWPLSLRFRIGKNFTVTERVHIDTEGSILYKCGKFAGSVTVNSVKKVIDYGDFYYIQLPFLNLTNEVVCQKSLLTQGSMEEFEELFKDKLIYRNK